MDTAAKRASAVLAAASLAASLVIKEEGWRNDPYRDVGGVWTNCAGNAKDVDPKRRMTDRECLVITAQRIAEHGDAIYSCLPADVPIEVRAAFTSFAYNVGASAACRSTAFRLANQHKFARACDALRLWNRAGGRIVRGLVKRREDERALCLSGVTPDGLI